MQWVIQHSTLVIMQFNSISFNGEPGRDDRNEHEFWARSQAQGGAFFPFVHRKELGSLVSSTQYSELRTRD